MNKSDKIICVILGLALAAWLWHSMGEQKKQAEAMREAATQEAAQGPTVEAAAKQAEAPKAEAAKPAAPAPAATAHKLPEKKITLETAEMKLELTSWGAAATRATMKDYAERAGEISAENPPLAFDFASAPMLALSGVPNLAADADYEIVAAGADWAEFRNAVVTRRVSLKPGYRVELKETFAQRASAPNRLSLGCMAMGSSKNDVLSIDSWREGAKGEVEHHGETDPLKSYLAGTSGGCGGAKSAEGIPEKSEVDVAGRRGWIAVKNRFFVAALAKSSAANSGFRAVALRDVAQQRYALKSVAAEAAFDSVPAERTCVFYLGPKKQSLLWDLGMKDVMEFGMWRWVCYPMVWLLNLFHGWAPSFGVGIILLTILVRLLFWPLTHKSTVGMRKMQEIQPKIKAIRDKFKDNPQRLQQETWQCYRENKVNPMSSCLPMLVQIPVFIALFTVLRSAVELRYAPFLWISDLSEPEALFASWFPFGGLNILPILMAATMALQSALTPSTGDKQQQRMMMVMMPAMMLVMFYNFPSALSLYWTLSQVFSIAQMWWIRKKYGAPAPVSGAIEPDAVEMPVTRQMRRHG